MTIRVNVAELEDEPAGELVMVNVYVPGGTRRVVETIREEIAPVEVGVMLEGEKLKLPHGMVPALTWHIAGFGETDNRSATG